jgi:hypothetical protein
MEASDEIHAPPVLSPRVEPWCPPDRKLGVSQNQMHLITLGLLGTECHGIISEIQTALGITLKIIILYTSHQEVLTLDLSVYADHKTDFLELWKLFLLL